MYAGLWVMVDCPISSFGLANTVEGMAESSNGEENNYCINNIDISIGGRQLFVPLSVFSDLINPSEVSVRINARNFVLSIAGGDASESYFVDIYFDKEKIIQRKLYSSENPSKPLEETRYWLVF